MAATSSCLKIEPLYWKHVDLNTKSKRSTSEQVLVSSNFRRAAYPAPSMEALENSDSKEGHHSREKRPVIKPSVISKEKKQATRKIDLIAWKR